MSMMRDHDGRLWIGTQRAGIVRLSDDGTVKRFGAKASDPSKLARPGIVSIYQDRQGDVWVSVWAGGVHRFISDEEGWARYPFEGENAGFGSGRIMGFAEDRDGDLWVASEGAGLGRYDRKNDTFVPVLDGNGADGFPTRRLYSLRFDSHDDLWVGTQGDGLYLWERWQREVGRSEVRHWTERDGLANGHVYGILEDESGRLWMSTNNGLSRYDRELEEFSNFSSIHGLQSREFNSGAYLKSADGRLHFGGIKGMNSFQPEAEGRQVFEPPIRLVEILRGNESMVSPLAAPSLDELRLTHRDTLVQFELASLDFVAPQRNRYEYRIPEISEEWIDLGSTRRVTLGRMMAGSYTFEARGTNSYGEWSSKSLKLPIVVEPPPWRSPVAYALYATVAVAILITVLLAERRERKRQEHYRRQLEAEVSERTAELAERNEELENLNDRLEEASLTDALTGVRNRRYLMTRIEAEISESNLLDPADRFVFLMVDLDGLKMINDTYGHLAGDMAIRRVCRLLQHESRRQDTVIRLGGDEFMLVARGLMRADAEGVAERIRRRIASEQIGLPDGGTISLSCSIGIACYPFMRQEPESVTWEQVIGVADRALYIAKTSGRNAWAGLYATDKTGGPRLSERVVKETESMVDAEQVEVRSSLGDQLKIGAA